MATSIRSTAVRPRRCVLMLGVLCVAVVGGRRQAASRKADRGRLLKLALNHGDLAVAAAGISGLRQILLVGYSYNAPYEETVLGTSWGVRLAGRRSTMRRHAPTRCVHTIVSLRLSVPSTVVDSHGADDFNNTRYENDPAARKKERELRDSPVAESPSVAR